MIKKISCFLLSLFIIFITVVGLVIAEEVYPSRTIELVVPYSPGGLNDLTSRIMAKYLQKDNYLGVQVAIINMPGPAGSTGSYDVMKARNDGYRLLWQHQNLITGYLTGVQDFTHRDFQPVAQLLETGQLMVVKADSAWENLKDIKEYAVENPGKIKYGVSFGAGSHFAGLEVARVLDVELSFIAGGADAERVPQVIRGDIDLMAGGGLTREYMEAGDLKGIAWLGVERLQQLPDVPTAIEQGFNIVPVFSLGVFAPKGIPEKVIDVWEEAIYNLSIDEEFLQEIRSMTMCYPMFRNSEELMKFYDSEFDRFKELAEIGGLLEVD